MMKFVYEKCQPYSNLRLQVKFTRRTLRQIKMKQLLWFKFLFTKLARSHNCEVLLFLKKKVYIKSVSFVWKDYTDAGDVMPENEM
jgi:hypothetical protein